MKSIARTANSTTASRKIPPMSYPRRIRTAAHLAWKTLRTGQHLPTVAFLDGARIGMFTGAQMAMDEFAPRGTERAL